MGNSLRKLFCCCCQKEQETPIVDEIPMQMFNETADLNSEGLDVEETTNSETGGEETTLNYSSEDVPLLEEESDVSFRFRVMADHSMATNCGQKTELLEISDILIPVDLIKDSDKLQCLFHVSVFNDRRERIVDLTIIQDMGPEPAIKHVLYWKDPRENTWQFNFSYRQGRKLYKQCRFSYLRKVLVWAATKHTKTNSEVNKMLLLSKKPGAIAVPSYIKQSAGCVIHITSYSLQLTKILDVILIQGKTVDSQSECYVQWRDPRTGRPQFSFTNQNGPQMFWNVFN